MRKKWFKNFNSPLVAIVFLVIIYLIYKSISLNKFDLSKELKTTGERNSVTVNVIRPTPTYIEISGIKQTALDVFIENNKFNPPERKIIARSEVNFVNFDKTPHQIVADDETFDTGRIIGGRSKKVAFLKPGIYAYHCKIHPEMKGTIVVDPVKI